MCPHQIDSSKLARRKADKQAGGIEAPRRAFELFSRRAKLVSGMPAVEIMKRLGDIPEQRSFFADLVRAALFREVEVKRTIERILAMDDPDAFTRACRLLGLSLYRPMTLTTYRRVEGDEFKGHVRIEYSSGEDITRQRRNLELLRDHFVRVALENDAVSSHYGNTVSWIRRGDEVSPDIESRTALPPNDGIERLVIPLSGLGIVDIRGHDLTFGFGLGDPHRTALFTALGISDLISMRLFADIDPQTGLYTKQAFMNFFRHYAELFLRDPNKQDASLILLEIDRLRTLSDMYGHDARDRILVGCRGLLEDILRTTDVISPPTKPLRERFAVLLADSNEHEAIIAAKRCRDMLRSGRLILENKGLGVTASFGIGSLGRAFEVLGRKTDTPVPHYTDEINRIKQSTSSIVERLIALASVLAEFAFYNSKSLGRSSISTPRIEGNELNAKLHR